MSEVDNEEEYLTYLKNSVFLGAGYLRTSKCFQPADILEDDMERFLKKRFYPMKSQITLLKARLSAAERVIEAARKHDNWLSHGMGYEMQFALKEFDQLTQRKEEK